MERDYVAEYIDLKKQLKDTEERYRATETLILSDDVLRSDSRITIQKGRESYELNDNAYESLEYMGITTTVTETRKKELKEFDVDVQKVLLENPEYYTKKTTKEVIKVK